MSFELPFGVACAHLAVAGSCCNPFCFILFSFPLLINRTGTYDIAVILFVQINWQILIFSLQSTPAKGKIIPDSRCILPPASTFHYTQDPSCGDISSPNGLWPLDWHPGYIHCISEKNSNEQRCASLRTSDEPLPPERPRPAAAEAPPTIRRNPKSNSMPGAVPVRL